MKIQYFVVVIFFIDILHHTRNFCRSTVFKQIHGIVIYSKGIRSLKVYKVFIQKISYLEMDKEACKAN
jgi:hypothetical protein